MFLNYLYFSFFFFLTLFLLAPQYEDLRLTIAPQYEDLRLTFEKEPSIVYLGHKFDLEVRLSNTSNCTVDITIYFDNGSGFIWSAVTGQIIARMSPGEIRILSVKLIPVALGLQQISGLMVVDPSQSLSYTFFNIAAAIVIRKET